MVLTEAELRQLWRDGRHPLPAFPPGTRFSPAAQDFIKDHRLEIRFAEPAPTFGTDTQLPTPASGASSAMTHYPFPFSLDSLHALAMLTAAEARRYQLPALARRLDALAESVLGLRAAEQQGRDPAPSPSAPAAGAPFAPGPTDHAILHWLNFLRASAAQAAAGQPSAWAAALNQISEMAADLERRVQSGELGWTPLTDTNGF